MTSTKSVTDVTDPIGLAITVAEKNGWEMRPHPELEEIMYVTLPGRYKPISLCVQWAESSDILLLRIRTPLSHIPEYATPGVHELINLMNIKSLFGSWFYDPTDESGVPLIVWRHEVHTDQSSVIDDSQMEKIMMHTLLAYDTFFPSLTYFFTAKPKMVVIDDELEFIEFGLSPDAAIELADSSRSWGRA